MINWRKGKAGFVGSAKRIIKGFFEPSYSVTSAAPAYSMSTQGVLSLIQSRGLGVSSAITDFGVSLSLPITPTTGYLSLIQSRGKGVSSAIDENGFGVESTI